MFFGWRVVAGSFLSLVLVAGFFSYSVSLLVSPVREEFGVSLEQVMYSLTLGTLLGLFASPVVGSLVDRVSLRLLMVLGCLLMAGGLFLLAATESILSFNIIFALTMSLSNTMAGAMASSAAVSRWFTSMRGRALGIAAMGTSIGGILIPALITWRLELAGWRDALQSLALLVLVVGTPFVWFNIRSHPADLGLEAQGISADDPAAASDAPTPVVLGMADIVRQAPFWYIGFSMGLLFLAYSSIIANLAPYAANLGVGDVQGSALIMFLSAAGLVGKLLFGIAADRISHRLALWLAQGLMLLAIGIFILEPPYWLMALPAVCMGLSTGGMLPVWNSMVAEYFGVASFGRAMGAMGPLITLSIMPGYAITGRLYDQTGNYTAALMLFTGCILLAALLLIPLRKPEA